MWTNQQSWRRIRDCPFCRGCTQATATNGSAWLSELADWSVQNEHCAQCKRKSFGNNDSIVGKNAAPHLLRTCGWVIHWHPRENGASCRAIWYSAERRSELATGWTCLLNTFLMGKRKKKTLKKNSQIKSSHLFSWWGDLSRDSYKFLPSESLVWNMNLKRRGGRRRVCHFFWYFVSSSILWSLQQCSSDNL